MGTSHHWNLGPQMGWQDERHPPVCAHLPVPSGTPPQPSPNGHEVEDVGHPGAVAQEAANADLEHDSNHQDPVPAGVECGKQAQRPGLNLSHQGAGRALGQRELANTVFLTAQHVSRPVCMAPSHAETQKGQGEHAGGATSHAVGGGFLYFSVFQLLAPPHPMLAWDS